MKPYMQKQPKQPRFPRRLLLSRYIFLLPCLENISARGSVRAILHPSALERKPIIPTPEAQIWPYTGLWGLSCVLGVSLDIPERLGLGLGYLG